ncbi:WASH complex subunit 2-like isoform X3 [Centruroides vittatus]|uniref:WASH complex subunit 2-like isoform X3 n=1 Tax=Centruroides vittatus TaxID=120091 RepID=UPI003510140C
MGQMEEVESDINTNGDRINNNEKDKLPWQKITSIADIQKQSRNWSLAGDAGLLCYLQDFSQQLISKTHEMEKTVDQLIHETKVTSSKINNAINDFHMLSNTQFIENRVYDDEIQPEPETQQKQEEQTKEQREAEIIPQITAALSLGLEVIENAFDKVELQQDSDSEDEGRTTHGESILEPKDPYLNRPLPHIIGSEAFYNDETIGLGDLVSNEIESENESDIKEEFESDKESSSDESFRDDNEEIKNPSVPNEKSSPPKSIFEGMPKIPRYSDSDSASSDLFRDEGEYLSASTETDEFVKEGKVNDDIQSISKNSIRSISKNSVEIEDSTRDLFEDDMFSVNKSEDVSYRKPSTPSKSNLFDSDTFEDPFGGIAVEEEKPKFNPEESKNVSEVAEKPQVKEKKVDDFKAKQNLIARDLGGLFQSEDDDDLFSPKKILEKQRKNTKTERTKTISLFDDESEERLFSDPSPVSASPEKSDLFKEKEIFDKPQIIEKQVSMEEEPVEKPKQEKIKANSLFLDDSEDDLFGVTEKEKKTSPFESLDSENTATKSIFTNPSISKKPEEVEKSKPEKEEKPARKPSLFSFLDEDDEDDDLFSLPTNDKKSKTVSNTVNKPRSGSSLFEDDSLFGKESSDSPEVDLFAVTPKSNVNIKKEILDSQRKLSDTASSPSNPLPKIPVGGVSLFSGVDLFGKDGIKPSSPEKEPKKISPTKEIKTTPEKEINLDFADKEIKLDEKSEENQKSPIIPKKDKTKIKQEQILSFDQPVNTSNVLSCVGKNRAKIQTRRRPPSRKNRQTTPSSSIDIPDSDPVVAQTEVDNVPLFRKEEKTEPVVVKKDDDLFSSLDEHKEVNLDIRSPSTEEDDIFPMSDGSPHKTLPSKESKMSFTDNLFLDLKEEKSNDLVDDIFGDDIFASKPKPDSSLSKDTNSLFSSSSSKIQKSKKEDSLFSSDSLDDDIFSIPVNKAPAPSTKKPSTVKKVKIESDIFEDPLLSFGNSEDKE